MTTLMMRNLQGELACWSTLAQRWSRAVASAGDSTFLEFERPGGEMAAWSYREFEGVVEQARHAMAQAGVRQGDRIQLVLPNCPAFIAVMLAAAQSGVTFLSSDPRSTGEELGRQAARVKPTLIVGGPEQIDAFGQSELVAPVIVVDPDDMTFSSLASDGHHDVPAASPAPLDTLGLMFTSGTTSLPKIVEITQANYAFAGDVMAAAAGLRAGSRFLVVLPLFHANAQYYSVSASISVGGTVILMAAFSASRFLQQAERFRATHASLFGAPIRMILARAEAVPLSQPLEHLWFSQNLTDDEYERFAGLVGCRPRQIYGMTETSPAVLMSRRLDPPKTTIGTPTPGCHVRLRDPETGVPIDIDEVGEIQVGGYPGLSLFAGYRDNEAAFTGAIASESDDGFVWFRTGDRGRLDSDGEVTFVGRGGDILKVAGENVSVVEIESMLVEHPDVLDAAVIGIPDPLRDEVPVAFVVPAGELPSSFAEDLMKWCEQRLSGPRVPREIHIVDELPRTAVGKIQRFRLQAGLSVE
jgi:crotonobetaine/carnitine-CoA ligase